MLSNRRHCLFDKWEIKTLTFFFFKNRSHNHQKKKLTLDNQTSTIPSFSISPITNNYIFSLDEHNGRMFWHYIFGRLKGDPFYARTQYWRDPLPFITDKWSASLWRIPKWMTCGPCPRICYTMEFQPRCRLRFVHKYTKFNTHHYTITGLGN